VNIRRVDLGVAAAAVGCGLVTCVVTFVPIRAVAVVPLGLILPGYALTRAIFTGPHPDTQPSQPMRLALVFALSLSTLIIGSVGLDLAPGGLKRSSWAILLASVTALASTVSLVRRRSSSSAAQAPSAERAGVPRPRLGSTILLLLAGAIAVAAFVASRAPLPARNAIGYTQLWILPAADGRRAVDLGVECDQLHATAYRLVVRHGRQSHSWRFALRPGRNKELTVSVQGPRRGFVTATLFRDGHAGAYRQVRLASDSGGSVRS
jgi:hypothetical protein